MRAGHASKSGTSGREPPNDEGVTIVEAGIVLPVVLVALLILIELGYLLYANLQVDEMAGHAARTASIARSSTDADRRVLDTVVGEIGATKVSRVELVVVYRATSREAEPSVACRSGVPDATCSVYRGTHLSASSQLPPCGWCPASREAGDLVGVWITYRQPSLTGLMSSRLLSSQSVARIEIPE